MSRPVILAVSFGTSMSDARSISIGAVESTLAECFPEFEVRRAFTSAIIRRILKNRDGISIDSVPEALEKLASEGVKEVYVMPTHMIEGDEYNKKIVKEAEAFRDRFEKLGIGRALLGCEADIDEAAGILDKITASYADGRTARVFMGHGTEHEADRIYAMLQDRLRKRGMDDIYIGTVESAPTAEDILEEVRNSGALRVVLSPLMLVAGDHAKNDMAGDGADSWKSVFEKAGLEVICRIKGLGSEYSIQKMIARHCEEMIKEKRLK